MQAVGMDDAAIRAELARRASADPPPTEPLALDADDEGPSASLFLALGTQWRTGGMAGQPTGLDYAAIRPTAELIGVPLDGRRFLDLRTMEAAALAVFAERARRP